MEDTLEALHNSGVPSEYLKQGWIKCGSGEHRSWEITSKIEKIVILGYEEKKKREEEEKEEEKKKRRKEKKKVEIEELTEEEEEHWDDKLKSSKTNE